MKKLSILTTLATGLVTVGSFSSLISCSQKSSNLTSINNSSTSKYCKIKFDEGSSGATITGQKSVTVRNGKTWSTVVKPTATREEYKWSYWYYETIDAEGKTVENKLTDASIVNFDSLTVYPKMEKEYQSKKVTLFLNGGTYDGKSIIETETTEDKNTLATILPISKITSPTDMDFSSWCDTNGEEVSSTEEIEEDSAYYIKWVDSSNFNGKDWSEVATACNTFESSTQDTTAAKTLCSALGYDASSQTSTDAKTILQNVLVGKTGTIKINGQKHTVRIVDAMHDVLTSDNTKTAALTFEFANQISDSNGYSLATYWKNTSTTTGSNYDYLNSDIRKAIDGQGSGTINWFEKDSKTFSTTYTGSVLDMLPTTLKSNLKTVNKIVNIYNTSSSAWVETTYNTNLFLPTVKEMGYSSSYAESSPTAYNYYSTCTSQTDTKRIKTQVKGSDGARTSYLSGTDLDGSYTGTKFSYAGYNNSTSGYGGVSWVGSPCTNRSNISWGCYYTGVLGYDLVYNYAFGVCPCFCL